MIKKYFKSVDKTKDFLQELHPQKIKSFVINIFRQKIIFCKKITDWNKIVIC